MPGSSEAEEASRRRLIEDTLESTDAEVDDLLALLEEAGFEIDEDTLLADLSVLGFEVIDEPLVDETMVDQTVVDDPVADDPVADDTGFEDRTAVAAPAPVRSHDSDTVSGPSMLRGWPTPVLVVASIAAVVLLISGALVVQSLLDGDDEGGPSEQGDIPTALAEAVPTTGTPEEFGPNHDPLLSEPDIALFFEEDTDGLPAPLPDVDWTVTGGEFGVGNGVALTSPPAENLPVMAVFPAASPDARVQVTLPQATAGAGLVFGGQDGSRLAWVLAPGFETVNLYRITDSGVELLVNPGPIPISPGMRLGLNLVGPTVELLAHGTVVATFDRGEGRGDVGLVAMIPAQPGVFDELLVQYA